MVELLTRGAFIGAGAAALMDAPALVARRAFDIQGLDWARSPALWPPLLIGLGTIVAPWFVMQPAMGAGIAASKTPNPGDARLRNLATQG
ncbi:MAG: DUF2938 family protein [Acidobacteria bacterium]|nr:DUF2938 family protein [Acidobacteriota bacterium]